MSAAEITSAVIAGLALLVAAATLFRGRGKDIKTEAECDGEDRASMQYIKRGIDDIKLELRNQGSSIVDHEKRITRCEESTKSLHQRFDMYGYGRVDRREE